MFIPSEEKFKYRFISGIDQVKAEVESYARTYTNSVRDAVISKIVATKDEVKNYANSEDEKLEGSIDTVKEEVKTYTNNKIVLAKEEVKSYSKNEIVVAKDEVQSYARDYTNSVRDQVKSYANRKINEAKVEVKSYTNNKIVAAKNEIKSFVNSEDEKLESKIHDWHNMGITLEGSNAGPDRGMVYYQGRPLCDDDSRNNYRWDITDATVICKMLGFSRATKAPHYTAEACFGRCPPAGTPFVMSGFKCTGSETHISDCPHDATVSSFCGNNGVTGSYNDIVGVECA